MLPPEIDLLEYLTGQDEPLTLILSLFGPPDDAKAQERARRVLTIYANEGLVEFLYEAEGEQRKLTPWQVRSVLEGWETALPNQPGGQQYLLRLTPKGYDAFVRDSAGFFDKLFSKQQP
jgi:hypothetical protein